MMPDFEEKTIDCSNVLQCLFNLSDLEEEILSTMKEGGDFRSEELAEELDRDQSTVYRALRHLVSCGLAYKEKELIRNGGYYYLYSARPSNKVKEDARECIDAWYEKMTSAVEELEEI